jgi:predicted PurR-regulated permease PerM
MEILPHLRTTGTALKNWFLGTTYDALAVGALWLIGLLIIGVPWAPFWAFLGAVFQYIPNFGPLLTVIAAEIGALFAGSDVQMKMLYVLILYAVIAVTDGLFLQPYLLKRTTKVPMWASILLPIVMGIILPFWGVLLAAPLLAVVYAFRERYRQQRSANAQLNAKPPDALPGG